MNWHETIEFIRTQDEFKDLVRDAYFDSELANNIERFSSSREFVETLKLMRDFAPDAKNILDIGAGNGISSINFARQGYDVTVVEPDPSNSVGSNAIKKLISEYNLINISVFEKFAEDIKFPDSSFDIVYVRQAMHHAKDLNAFIREASRVLKPGGILLTIRDHVIFSKKDKDVFLLAHPLHKFYGGENAFTSIEYKKAFKLAGLQLIEELKYFDSPINYFPQTETSISQFRIELVNNIKKSLKSRLGFFSKLPFVIPLYKFIKGGNETKYFEKQIPGRMYSYILKK